MPIELSFFEKSKLWFRSKPFNLLYLIAVLIAVFSYYTVFPGNGTSAGISDETTQALYGSMKREVWKDDNTIAQYKVSYDKIIAAIYSIPPKSREPFFSNSINKVKKQDFNKLLPILKDKLKDELKYEILDPDLNHQIDHMKKKVKIIRSSKEDFQEIRLSYDAGGKSTSGFGILALMQDKTDPDSIVVGVSIYREKWVEQDHVMLVKGKWEDPDILGFLKYQWYLRMKDK